LGDFSEKTVGSAATPTVFVTVGTDHHPFDRLVRWIDAWLEGGGGRRARCYVQRGTSVIPSHAESSDFLGYEAMREAIDDAAAVVCHGGPGTIMLAAHAGKVPIVVPRIRARGEHVDDHQVAFARRIAIEGTIALAEDEGRFRLLLDRAVTAPLVSRPVVGLSPPEAVHRFEAIIEQLMNRENDPVAKHTH
jgi:UDP-N-acetylglucosamine transferase subunit ALG13